MLARLYYTIGHIAFMISDHASLLIENDNHWTERGDPKTVFARIIVWWGDMYQYWMHKSFEADTEGLIWGKSTEDEE